jgi:ABC-2 type transport system permease protein
MTQLIGIELYKIFTKSRNYIGFAVISFLVLVIQFGISVDGQHYLDFAIQSLSETFYMQGNLLNGYFIAHLLMNAMWILLPLLISFVTADLLAGEMADGSMRMLLCRPVPRSKVILAKYIAGCAYATLLMIFFSTINLGAGIFFFGKGDLLVMKQNLVILESSDVLWRFGAAFGLGIIAMWAVTALSFVFSVISSNPVTPIAATIATIIATMIISAIDLPIFRMINPFLLSSYIGSWRIFFNDPINVREIYTCAIALALHIIIFMAFTMIWFKRKDILC